MTIEVDRISHRYGRRSALEEVSFRIDPGEIVGFLGPNGAGKSTLLRILATYLVPSNGRAAVSGFDVLRAPLEVRRRVGYLPEHDAQFEEMSVEGFVQFIARARGIDRASRARRVPQILERCGLAAVRTLRVEQCSKGYRRRLGLAAALVHDPPVLLLDEPTHGLDPRQVAELRAFLRELARERVVLYSSHILAEVAETATRLVALAAGRLVLDEELSALEERARAESVTLEDLLVEAFARAGEPVEAGV